MYNVYLFGKVNSVLVNRTCPLHALEVIHLDFSPAFTGKYYGEAGFLSNDNANKNPLKRSREERIKRELN